ACAPAGCRPWRLRSRRPIVSLVRCGRLLCPLFPYTTLFRSFVLATAQSDRAPIHSRQRVPVRLLGRAVTNACCPSQTTHESRRRGDWGTRAASALQLSNTLHVYSR